ncbi:MAG: hypothetical protein ACRCS3_02815 [Paracoccaceae bacterium]
MSDIVTHSDPSEAAIAAALPEIRQATKRGWALLIGALVITLVILVILAGSGIKEAAAYIITVFLGAFAVAGAVSLTRAAHERAVMPIIAKAFSLQYEKSPKGFFETIPRALIPFGGRRSVDDLMSGQVAGRNFRFAECTTATGGKNSRTLFKGVVLIVDARGGMPDIIIASEQDTKGFLIFPGRVNVDDMQLVHQVQEANGMTYGLWTASSQALQFTAARAFMDRILSAGPRILGSSTLCTVLSTSQQHCISLKHAHDLFKIGGMFAKEGRVISDIRHAATEIAHPIELVAEILRAEEALFAAKA